MVSKLFPAEEYEKDNPVYAAPCSVYQPRDGGSVLQSGGYDESGSVYDSGSVFRDGSAYGYVNDNGSAYESGSVYRDGSVMQSGSVYDTGSYYQATSSQYVPQATPRLEPREQTLFHREPGLFRPTPLPDVPIIPFKDGSSLINIRPKTTQQEPPELNLRGGSWLKSDAYKARDKQFFISDPEDKVDIEVAEYFKAHPQAYLKTNFTRIRRGVYSMCDREVHVQWEESKNKEKKGRLMVRDGATKVLFSDYMEMKDYCSALPDAMYNPYNSSVFKAKNALQLVPQEQRITFCDVGLDLSRKDAMIMAKEQATAREAAATDWLTKQAKAPPPTPLLTERRMVSNSFDCTHLRTPSHQLRNTEVPPPLISTSHVPPRCGNSAQVPPRCGNSFSIPAAQSTALGSIRGAMPPRVRAPLPHGRLR